MCILSLYWLCVFISLQKIYMGISVLMQNKCQNQLIVVWTARLRINRRRKWSQKVLLFSGKPGLALKTLVFVFSKECRFGVLFHKIYNVTMVKCETWLYKNSLLDRTTVYNCPAFQGSPKAALQTRLTVPVDSGSVGAAPCCVFYLSSRGQQRTQPPAS